MLATVRFSKHELSSSTVSESPRDKLWQLARALYYVLDSTRNKHTYIHKHTYIAA